jgi:rhamnosyl/mannosyltransferase
LVTSWHSDVIRQKHLARLFGPIERAIVRRSDALITSSPNYLDSSPTLRRNRARTQVIPYGIDPEPPHDPARVAHLRARYGPRIVLGVGRLIYYKGFDHLIRAMATVAGHLLIVGEGPLRGPLEYVARTAGVAARVTFLGNLDTDELFDAYHAADVFVIPSVARSEAFGIVQLEAMACGRPVVNTRIGSGVPFVSIDGETGLTVEPGVPEALSAALNLLLDNPELRDRFGAAGASRVRERFSLTAMIDQTLALYRVILAGQALADQ